MLKATQPNRRLAWLPGGALAAVIYKHPNQNGGLVWGAFQPKVGRERCEMIWLLVLLV